MMRVWNWITATSAFILLCVMVEIILLSFVLSSDQLAELFK